MTTIQMTLDAYLLKKMDRIVKRMQLTRSAFIRDSVQHYMKTLEAREQEARHRAGYTRHPAASGEFDVWETEQDWGD